MICEICCPIMGYQKYKFSHDLKRSRGLWASIHTSCKPKALKIPQCFSALEAVVLSHRDTAISHSENWETAPKIRFTNPKSCRNVHQPIHLLPGRARPDPGVYLLQPFPTETQKNLVYTTKISRLKWEIKWKIPFPSVTPHGNISHSAPVIKPPVIQSLTINNQLLLDVLNVYIWHKNSRLNRRVWNSSLLAVNTICLSFRLLCKVRN